MKRCIIIVIALVCSFFSVNMASADIETNLYGYFTNAGIWQWNGSTWSQVTPNNPQLMNFFKRSSSIVKFEGTPLVKSTCKNFPA